MAPLIKDTLDLGTPAAESNSAARESAAPSQLRADAVSLEVQLKVHGSRVTEVGRGLPPRTEPFEEQSSTMIVFPQGAVLRLAAPVSAGQMLVLTNLKTRQDAICRIIKVRPNGTASAYVEIEFTSRQPGYWGVTFSSDSMLPISSVPSRPAIPPAPVVATPPSQSLRPVLVPPAPSKVAPSKAPPSQAAPSLVAPSRPAPPQPAQIQTPSSAPTTLVKSPATVSAFTTIGTQEKIQASATEITKAPPPPALPRNATPFASASVSEPPLDEAKLTAAIAAVPHVEPPAPIPSLSLEELIGDTDDLDVVLRKSAREHGSALSTPETENTPASAPSAHSERPIFGAFAASASPSSDSAALSASAKTIGTLSDSSPSPRASHQNWLLIAACVGFLFVAVAGGIYLFRPHASLHVSAAASAVPRSSTNSAPSSSADSSVMGVAAAAAPLGPSSEPVSRPAVQPVSTPTAAASRAPAPPSPVEPAHLQPPLKPAVTSAMVSDTLNSHPSAPQRTSDDVSAEAPTVESSPVADDSSSALPGGLSAPSSISIPLPRLEPDGPVKVGGQVKEPKLVFSPAPLYPRAALESNIQGDIVIQAVIDKHGNVADAHIVSGPLMLRQPALDALRRWKYQPSSLDGQPVSVQILVTMHFHHQ